jgi:hypothetical protein
MVDFIGYKTGTPSSEPLIGFISFLDFTGLPTGQETSPDIIIAIDGE